MKLFFIKIGILILKIIYCPMKWIKSKNKVVYISRQFNNPTLDFSLIKEEMERIDPSIQNVLLTKRLEKGFVNTISYVFHMLKQMYHIATSKVVIVDTYCIPVCVLKHKETIKIIQIWHAMGAIKKFGYQTLGKNAGAEKEIADVMCMHKNYDYVLCSSKVTKDYYCEAFNVDESKIKYIGMPRVDYILKEKNTDEIYKEYPQLKDKINVLYVPTFRKGKKIRIKKLIDKFDTTKYNLIIKLHPLDRKEYKYIEKDGVIFDEKFKSYDLLEVSDKIITDYSSLAIEVTLLNKPLYFYAYDFDEYGEDPGLNLDFEKEEIGKYLATTVTKLLKLLDEEYDYEILNRFKNRYLSINLENCTNQLAKYVLELMNYEYKEETEEEHHTTSQEKLNV